MFSCIYIKSTPQKSSLEMMLPNFEKMKKDSAVGTSLCAVLNPFNLEFLKWTLPSLTLIYPLWQTGLSIKNKIKQNGKLQILMRRPVSLFIWVSALVCRAGSLKPSGYVYILYNANKFCKRQ